MAKEKIAAPDTRIFSSYPVPALSNWTVTGVRSALAQHDNGAFHRSAMLAEQLDRNPRIASALNTRSLAVLALPARFDASNKADGRQVAAITREAETAWREGMSRAQLAGAMRWLHMLGFALFERVWSIESGRAVQRAKLWHPSLVYHDPHLDRYVVQTQEGLVAIGDDDPKWCLWKSREDRPWLAGVVRVLGLQDTIRNFAVRDWARYSEVHGLPIRIARVPVEAKPDDKARFGDGIAALGTENTVVAPVNKDGSKLFDLDLVEPRDQSWQGFQDLIRQCDADAVIAILGQNKTVSSSSPGVYVPNSGGEEIRHEYLQADAAAIADLAQEWLEPWAAFNYGNPDAAPPLCIETEPAAELSTRAKTLNDLGDALTKLNEALTGAGVRVDVEALAAAYGVPLVKGAPPAPPTQPNQQPPAPVQ